MTSIDGKRLYKPFVWTIVLAGCLVSANSLVRFSLYQADLPLLLFALTTVIVASRIVVRFFRYDCSISVSDIFIFLALLIFGADSAILIGATESYYSSLRITKKRLTRAFNAAAMACSTFITATLLNVVFGNVTELRHGAFSLKLIGATFLMALSQYIFNSGL